MKSSERIMWVVGILLIDTLMVIIPVVAFFSVYIILSRPPWFQEWISKLYQDI